MPEKIFTIPLNEAFDRMEGCPLCHLRDRLEEQTLDSALGAAIMEPSVRIEMNKEGFCHDHLSAMYRRKNKLALGLILESHLDELGSLLEAPVSGGKKGLFSKKPEGEDAAEALTEQVKNCYVCRRVHATERRYASNAAWLWESDPAFRDKLQRQPYFCLSHTALLLRAGKQELKEKDYSSLYAALTSVTKTALSTLRENVTAFTVSFDHRNAEKPLSEEERSALERAVTMLQ